jgi:hypothetical protein
MGSLGRVNSFVSPGSFGHRPNSSNCRFDWDEAPRAGTIRRAAAPQAGTIRIEVWDGVVQDVSNVPPGWDYEVVDYDHLTSWGSADARAE